MTKGPRPPSQPIPSSLVAILSVAFLLSGGAGLIHEVVWTRLLGLLFGVTTFAVSTVLAAYMGGLALGSWWAGRRAERIADPPRAYALLEIGIGLFAVLVPWVLNGVQPLYGWIWNWSHSSFATFSVLRFLVAGGLLLVPTFMMGATFPILADYLSGRRGLRLSPQWLYTVNLAGAVLGVIGGGFVLLPAIGVRGTILAAGATNVAAGAIVLLSRARSGPAEPTGPVRKGVGSHAIPLAERVEGSAVRVDRLVLAAAFASGFTSLAAQVAWTRVLLLIVGSTAYAFSTVLLVALAALAAGGAWASWRGSRPSGVYPDLATVHVLMALGMVGAVYAVNGLPQGYSTIFQSLNPESLAGAVASNAVVLFAILIPPLLFAGTILPLAILGALPASLEGTGRAVGTIYAVNTIGSILGAVASGFILVPWLGSQATLLGIAAVASILGALFAFRSPGRRLKAALAIGSALATGLVFVQPAWDQRSLNAQVFEPGPMLDRRLAGSKDRVLFHREGPTATVMVLERDKDRFMRINGRINASTGLKDMPTQVLLAQIPLALAPRAGDVFLLGYGSGVTAGAALQSPARRVTVVEIEPAVIDGSRYFDHVNHQPLSDSRLLLERDDARHILLASPDIYDVIISEPSHPWVAGVSNLFTRDFFSVAARRLREDGVFAQWLQTYQLSRETFRVLLATFQSVYPEVYVFGSAGTDCILLGSRRPLRIDLAELDRRWADERVRSEFDRVGVAGPEHLLADLYTGPEDVRDIVRGARINTDDNMHVELTAPRDLIRARNLDTREIFGLIARTRVERVLEDPDDLISNPGRLSALVKGYASWGRKLEHDHYRALLVGLQRD